VPSGISIEESRLGAVWVVRAGGEIDFSSAPALSNALRAAWQEGEGTVVLDLSDATFMDSAGLHALLNAHRRLTRERRRFLIACPQGPIRDLMQVTRVNDQFELYENLEAALAAAPAD
jgi:anti-anti-sigma factor